MIVRFPARLLLLLVCTVVLSAACSRSKPLSVENELTPADVAWVIDTYVDGKKLMAGETLEVRCDLNDPDESDVAWPTLALRSSPALAIENIDNRSFRIAPTKVGNYELACVIEEAEFVDPFPVEIEVISGGVAFLKAAVTKSSEQAGVLAGADCIATDVFDNPVEIPSRWLTLSVSPSGGVEVSVGTVNHFSLEGRRVGTYDVVCGVNDLSPELIAATFEVLTGEPTISETTVERTTTTPDSNIAVSCEFFDAFGNPVTGVSPRVMVRGANRSAEVEALSGMEFHETAAGEYYVFCAGQGIMAGDESPAWVEVLPGRAFGWEVDALAQDCYWQDRDLPLNWVVYDKWDNVIEDAIVQVTAIPEDGLETLGHNRYRLTKEADYDIFIEVMGETHPDADLVPYATSFRVDSTPPQFHFSSPLRAEMLRQGDYDVSPVALDGFIQDALSPVESLVINDQRESVGGTSLTEYFYQEQSSQWGVNLITGETADSCGNRRVHAHSYLRGPAYGPAAVTPLEEAKMTSGIVAHLNQPIWDDGHRPSPYDDLASLGEAILLKLDFDDLAPAGATFAEDPWRTQPCGWEFASDSGYWIGRHPDSNRRVTVDGPFIDFIDVVEGGIRIKIHTNEFRFPIKAIGAVLTCIGVNPGAGPVKTSLAGDVVAESITVDATVKLALVAGQPQVAIESTQVSTTSPDVELDCGPLQFLCDAVTSVVMPLVKGLVEDAMEDVIADNIAPILQDFLTNFALQSQFDIPSPIDMTLNLNSSFDKLNFAEGFGDSYGQIGLAVQVHPSARGNEIPETAKGPLIRGGATPTFSNAPSDYEFGIALKDDLLNQVLWSLWYGGGLSFDDLVGYLASVGEGDSELSAIASLKLEPALPPVMMPGADGLEFELGMGDLYVEADINFRPLLGSDDEHDDQIRVGAYITLLSSAGLDIDPTTNTLELLMDESPTIAVEVVAIDDEGYQGPMSDLLAKAMQLILPRLLTSTIGSIPLPSFDLGSLAAEGVVPAGTVWELTDGDLERDSSGTHLLLTGALE